MWAFDLEKRQHLFASGDKKPKPPRVVEFEDGSTIEMKPSTWTKSGKVEEPTETMAGSWTEVEGSYISAEGVVASKKDL